MASWSATAEKRQWPSGMICSGVSYKGTGSKKRVSDGVCVVERGMRALYLVHLES
jgi:hypothetical protein